jgi:hypothetical protein
MTNPQKPDDARYSFRQREVSTIHLRKSCSRYQHGEVVIETVHRYSDGQMEQGPASRVFLGVSSYRVISELWDVLFEAVLVARQYDVRDIVIEFHSGSFIEWKRAIQAVCILVAYELNVTVFGVEFSKQ